MKFDKGLALTTLRNTALAALYVFGVSQLMANGQKLFGNMNSSVGPFAMLPLFVLSAAVVGGLIFGFSVYLFFDNKKEESVLAAVYSVGWLAVFTVAGFVLLYFIK